MASGILSITYFLSTNGRLHSQIKLRDTIYGSDDYGTIGRSLCPTMSRFNRSNLPNHYHRVRFIKAAGHIIRPCARYRPLPPSFAKEKGGEEEGGGWREEEEKFWFGTRIDRGDDQRWTRKLFNSSSHKLFNALPAPSINFDTRFR